MILVVWIGEEDKLLIKSIYFCDVNDCIFIDEHLLFEYYIGKNNTEKVKVSDRASKEIECIIDKVNRAYSDNDKQVIYYDRRLVYDSYFESQL